MNSVSAHDAQQWLVRDDMLLIDVREPIEHASAHIPQAALAPLSKLSTYSPPEHIKQVIVHCKTGVRSQKAIEQLQQKFPDITFFNLEQGIEGWQQAGFPIGHTEQQGLTLQQQVNLTTGVLIVMSLSLSYALHPAWLLIGVVCGFEMLIAKLTGTCALCLVLARMPWNKL